MILEWCPLKNVKITDQVWLWQNCYVWYLKTDRILKFLMISRIKLYIDNLFGAVLLIINRIQVKLIFYCSVKYNVCWFWKILWKVAMHLTYQ
jgi:hypothetical protein